jgi:hypothetical protein
MIAAATVLFHLFVTDPSPRDPHLHGAHTHALDSFETMAECVEKGRQEVKAMNNMKGFKKDAKYECRIELTP